MTPALKILIVDANPVRAAILDEGLREAGFTDLVQIGATNGQVTSVESHDPDVVVIDLASPDHHALAEAFLVSQRPKRPVTLFVEPPDPALIEAAVEAGVAVYAVDGLNRAALKPILQACISRFDAASKLREGLDEVRSQRDDRALIDHAKGIVMRLKGLPEAEAYALMRRTAMNEKRKLVDIARSIITATEVLK
ncbi:ANTAR domain-containing response regulator [Bosea sp. 2YAB26]|uniref:ANTAR domain-containing response regulator n=1 Tax=Bosea sp. 2YAB26 TaxID=3237478 RepID=UPI003F91E391